jgi:predicted RND superfamily exporter protein
MNSPSPVSARASLELLACASFERPKLVFLVWALLFGASIVGLTRLQIATNTGSILDRRSEEWRFYQQAQRTFGGDEAITVAIRTKGAFDLESLARIDHLTEELATLDGVRRVDSLSTVPVVAIEPNGAIRLDPPLSKGVPRSQAEADHLGMRVLADRVMPDVFASRDGMTLALNLMLDSNGVENSRELIDSLADRLRDERVWISGVPVFRVETDAKTRLELLTFVPLTICVIALLLFAIFRSIGAVAFPIAVGGLGTLVVMGVMGALSVPVTISTVILPSVFIAMGSAYAIHLLVETAGLVGHAEIREAIVRVARPLSLSGLTTAIGFTSVAVVPIDALRQLGGFGALGTFVLLAASLTVGPAVLAIWPPPPISRRFQRLVEVSLQKVLLGFVLKFPGLVISFWGLAAIVFAAGVSQIRVETDVTKWFPKGGSVRDAYEGIRSTLSGISPVNIVVTGSHPGAMVEPATVALVDGLASELRKNADIGKVVSVTDLLREIEGAYREDGSESLPTDRAVIAQYMLLLESHEQFGDLVNFDRSAANILLRVNNNGSEHLLGIAGIVDDWWSEHGVEAVSVRTTGIMYEFARAQRAIAVGQLQGLALDLITIAVLLLVIFRVPRIALVAVIPNALPLVIVFGLIGFAGAPLDAGTVVVGNLALGVAVDETVFVLSTVVGQNSGNMSAALISRSFEKVTAALVATTAAVAIGFAVLGFSTFAFTQKLGLLTAGVMMVCVAANVTLLPALLIKFKVQVVAAHK